MACHKCTYWLHLSYALCTKISSKTYLKPLCGELAFIMTAKQIGDHDDCARNYTTIHQIFAQILHEFEVRLNAALVWLLGWIFFPPFPIPTLMLKEKKQWNGKTRHNNPHKQMADNAFVIPWYCNWKKSSLKNPKR